MWSLYDFKEPNTTANICQLMVRCKILRGMRSLLALSWTSRHFSRFSPFDLLLLYKICIVYFYDIIQIRFDIIYNLNHCRGDLY